MKHITEHIDYLKNKLEQDIKVKEAIVRNVVANYKSSEDTMSGIKLKALNLKKEIQQKGDDIKEAIDLFAIQISTNADNILKQHEKDADDVVKKLKTMENNLKAHIEMSKEQYKHLNYENVAQTSLQSFNYERDIPEYSDAFQFSLLYDLQNQPFNFREIVGNVEIGLW